MSPEISPVQRANNNLILARTELEQARNAVEQLHEERAALMDANADIFARLREIGDVIHTARINNNTQAVNAALVVEARICDDYDAVFGPIDQEIDEAGHAVHEARMRLYRAIDDVEDEEIQAAPALPEEV